MSDGVKGTIPCQLFGGPLDGAKYGDLPDLGAPYTDVSLTLPLAQPVETSAKAVYTCRGDVPVGGLWQFFYERTEYPQQLEVIDLPIPHPPFPGAPTGTGVSSNGFDADAQKVLARGIAGMAHRGQADRDGTAFIAHVARVASHFDPLVRPVAHCAAWLHDIGSRSALTLEDLRAAGIHPSILEVVDLLTRPQGMDDLHYYDRILSNPLALAIKLADLDDRAGTRRLDSLDANTRNRLARRYSRARRLLTTTTDKASK